MKILKYLIILHSILGNIPPEQRYLAWNKYRVFFLTPQVLANDLSLNKCPSDTFRCIIVDEAHRATKDYAYVQVIKYYTIYITNKYPYKFEKY